MYNGTNINRTYYYNVKLILLVILIAVLAFLIQTFNSQVKKEEELLSTLILDKDLIKQHNCRNTSWTAAENDYFKVK